MDTLCLLRFAHVLLFVAHLSGISADFRHISYEDLAEKQTFEQEGVTTFSQLLFDVARQQVVVGARDNLYRLTLGSLTAVEHATWPAAKEKIGTCQDKGQSVEDCRNYIKVLLSNGKSLFSCGTNAFSPRCTWREIENINSVTSSLSGVAMCPYSPHSNVTALLAGGQSGGLFAGTPTDFSGADAAIYRTLASPNLRTRQYDSKWLNDPQFVGSFETEEYVYFLFRESAVEYINCGKRIYSRIARVCKYDPGSPMLMKDTWTTFSKARLNCSVPGEFPFYYDEIQGAAYLSEEGLVYATFTTSSNAIAGSAICAFNMSAIAASFEGPFKHQENTGAAWERKSVAQHEHKCGPPGATGGAGSRQLTDNQRYQLMDDAVQPTTLKPLYTSTLERFTHLAVDITASKLYRSLTVLYVATNEGLIKKISILPHTFETCVIEVWGPLPSSILKLQYLRETKSLYVGTNQALIRIPTIQCHRHRDAQSCIDAQDPYCGWNEHQLKCAPAPGQSAAAHLASHWRQEADRCPRLTGPVHGGWSAWGSWTDCQHEEGPDNCRCQMRECNNPAPQNGGAECTGSRVRVANCTVHGGWTAWSAWSPCSQSCGPAVKTRRRSCTNPAPQHNGRVCVGSEREESFCIELPPCPSIAAAPAWSSWGPWSACSKPCSGGFRTRRRTCESMSRKDGLPECPGCSIQFEECNEQPCPESRKYLTSGWLNSGNRTADGGYTERRYRFICRAQTDEPSSVRVQAKEEERHCSVEGSCSRRNLGTLPSTEEIPIVHPSSPAPDSRIPGQWSCWTEWSGCSVSCGFGVRARSRVCLGPGPCEGSNRAREPCEMPGCEWQRGWDSWSAWSNCEPGGLQRRERRCLLDSGSSSEQCLGPSWQSRWCLEEVFDNEIAAAPRVEMASLSVGALLGGCLLGFLLGLGIAALLCFYYLKRRKTRVIGSPHYISKQNPYVTVPLKEVKLIKPPKQVNAKRQPSFSGSCGNGTLRSSKNNSSINALGSPKLYPKALEYESATLKRNSREQHIRAELDQEKYY